MAVSDGAGLRARVYLGVLGPGITPKLGTLRFLPGYLKAVWPKIFGPVFPGFSAAPNPGALLDRRSPPLASICTRDQPCRPILRPNGDERKIPLPSGTKFLIDDSSTDLSSSSFRGLGGPGGPVNHARRLGGEGKPPPIFLSGFWASRGRPRPENRRCPAGSKIMYSET